jgi:hypothetical protein
MIAVLIYTGSPEDGLTAAKRKKGVWTALTLRKKISEEYLTGRGK